VNFGRTAPPPASEENIPVTLVLTVVGASALPGSFRFTQGRLDIGRVSEVRDRDGRLVRRNAVVISDADDPNGTVSRRHAHVTAGGDRHGPRSFAVYDDTSRYGTRIVRKGQTVTVHPGTLGVRLRDGDELHFGEVMVIVRLDPEPA
jgi:pSer/pThr/pTyr-binding forkhead associated (FHA) protein